MKEEILDIENWSNIPKKFFAEIKIKHEERSKSKTIDLRTVSIDHVKLYCLLKCKVSNDPNGIFTMLMINKPIGNIFWWDFLLESDKGYIHFVRSQSKIEVTTNIIDEQFKIIDFIKFNFKKYSQKINETKLNLESHILYVNHYKSYWECTKKLWEEIEELKISPKDVEKEIEEKPDKLQELLSNFIDDNIKFHSFGKSVLLNAAFTIEAFITMLIRITAKPELKDYPDVLKKHLNSNFSDKLKNLKYYSFILKSDIDLKHQAIKDAVEVMRLRNKFVHADLSSKLNEVGNVYFDRDFPVFPAYKYSPIIENISRIYQIPDFKQIKFAYNSSNEFVKYIKSLFIEHDMANAITMILGQNPIGFNEESKNFSAIFSNILIDARFE